MQSIQYRDIDDLIIIVNQIIKDINANHLIETDIPLIKFNSSKMFSLNRTKNLAKLHISKIYLNKINGIVGFLHYNGTLIIIHNPFQQSLEKFKRDIFEKKEHILEIKTEILYCAYLCKL